MDRMQPASWHQCVRVAYCTGRRGGIGRMCLKALGNHYMEGPVVKAVVILELYREIEHERWSVILQKFNFGHFWLAWIEMDRWMALYVVASAMMKLPFVCKLLFIRLHTQSSLLISATFDTWRGFSGISKNTWRLPSAFCSGYLILMRVVCCKDDNSFYVQVLITRLSVAEFD